MGGRRRPTLWLAVVALAVGIGVSALDVPAGATDIPPNMAVPSLLRGSDALVSGGGLTPGEGYTLTSDYMRFAITTGSTPAPTLNFTASADGRFNVFGYLPVDVAIDVVLVHVSVTPYGQSEPLLTRSAAVLPPRFSFSKCPGGSTSVTFAGFPPGMYALSSQHATFFPSTLTVDATGVPAPVNTTIDADAPATFFAYATPSGSEAPASTASVTLPPLHMFGYQYYDAYPMSGSCFSPGGSVTFDTSAAGVTFPTNLVADSEGLVDFSISVRASVVPKTISVETLDASGRTITTDLAVPPTRMNVGQHLDETGLIPPTVVSPNMHYDAYVAGCSVWLDHNYSVGGQHYSPNIWWAGIGNFSRTGCHLSLQRNGNLVLYTHAGKRLWSAGTQRTGHDNRLVLRNDGNLVLLTSAGRVVWSSRYGRAVLRSGESLLPGQSLQTLLNRFVEAKLLLRTNGNLVYWQYGRRVWSTRSAGSGAARLTMQRNGNLVLRRADGSRVWAAGTAGAGNHLVVRGTGLFIINAAGSRVWGVG